MTDPEDLENDAIARELRDSEADDLATKLVVRSWAEIPEERRLPDAAWRFSPEVYVRVPAPPRRITLRDHLLTQFCVPAEAASLAWSDLVRRNRDERAIVEKPRHAFVEPLRPGDLLILPPSWGLNDPATAWPATLARIAFFRERRPLINLLEAFYLPLFIEIVTRTFRAKHRDARVTWSLEEGTRGKKRWPSAVFTLSLRGAGERTMKISAAHLSFTSIAERHFLPLHLGTLERLWRELAAERLTAEARP